MTTPINTNLQAIADLCKEPRVKCSGNPVNRIGCVLARDCKGGCNGTGRIPDPKLKGLLNVVQDECGRCEGLKHIRWNHVTTTWVGTSSPKATWCEACGRSGYIVAPIWQKHIEDGREGTLVGALHEALYVMGYMVAEATSVEDPLWGQIEEVRLKVAACFGLSLTGINPDLAATEVVKKWLEERHEAT